MPLLVHSFVCSIYVLFVNTKIRLPNKMHLYFRANIDLKNCQISGRISLRFAISTYLSLVAKLKHSLTTFLIPKPTFFQKYRYGYISRAGNIPYGNEISPSEQTTHVIELKAQHFIYGISSMKLKVSILKAILFISHTFAYISSVQTLAPVIFRHSLGALHVSRYFSRQFSILPTIPCAG